MFLINITVSVLVLPLRQLSSAKLKGVIVKSILKWKELKHHHYLEKKKLGMVTGINQLAPVTGCPHNPTLWLQGQYC